jgi:putative Mg2+ transporter-C (MgtC) family protein
LSGGEDTPELTTVIFRIAAAVALALPIGWDRGRRSRSRSAGLRTYPLVAMATCAFVLTGWASLGPSSDEQADVLYGILTGVGFIGSGALLKDPVALRGMVTAISLWVTVAIGIAAAYGLYGLAMAMSVLSLVSLKLHWLAPKEEQS